MRNFVVAVFFVFVGILLSFPMNRCYKINYGDFDTVIKVDSFFETHTQIIRDTVIKYLPSPVRIDTVEVIKIEKDTALAYEHKEYSDSDFMAWVSGIDAKLDSIRILRSKETTTNQIKVIWDKKITEITARKNYNLSISLGVGVGPDFKVRPVACITVGKTLFTF